MLKLRPNLKILVPVLVVLYMPSLCPHLPTLPVTPCLTHRYHADFRHNVSQGFVGGVAGAGSYPRVDGSLGKYGEGEGEGEGESK